MEKTKAEVKALVRSGNAVGLQAWSNRMRFKFGVVYDEQAKFVHKHTGLEKADFDAMLYDE